MHVGTVYKRNNLSVSETMWSAVSWHGLPQRTEDNLSGICATRVVRLHLSHCFYIWDRGNRGSLFCCVQGWSAAFYSNTPWTRTLRLASPQLLVTEKFSRNPEEQGNIEKHWTCFPWWRGHMCRELGGSVTQGLGTEFYRALLNTDHVAECVNYGKVWRLEMSSLSTYSLLSSICTLFSNMSIWELKIRLSG